MTTDPADAALAWIRAAIAEEHPDMHPDDVALLALTLDAISEDYDVPAEECVLWVHGRDFGADPETWRAHCREYVALRRRLCRT